MKVFICIANGFYFLQVTSARPTLSDEEIQGIRADLVNYTNLEPKLIQNIMDALKKYRSKPAEFLSLALQGDTCTKKSINAIHIAAVAAGKSDEEINEMYNVEGAIQLDLTDNQFKMIGDDLNKEHASEKVQHAIKIFRGHQKGASPEEAKSAAIDTLVSEANAISSGCPSESSTN